MVDEFGLVESFFKCHPSVRCSPFPVRHTPRLREAVGDDRIEGGLDQLLNEGIRGIVGAGGFACISGSRTLIRDTREAKSTTGDIQSGDQFEEGLIDGTELLGAHVAVVNSGAFFALGIKKPAQLAHGSEEIAIRDGGAV